MSNRLDLDRDRKGHLREWRVQRVGWCLWVFVLVAAMLGLTGSGPLSTRSATSHDGRLTAEYDRFVRHHCSTEITLSFNRSTASDDFRVWLNQEFFDAVAIEAIEPQPREQSYSAGGILLAFRAIPPEETARIVIRCQPESLGPITCQLASGKSELTLSQFVYP